MERGKGQGRGRGGGDSGQMIHCFRCGQGGHMANACNHPKVKDIPKNADGTWPIKLKTTHKFVESQAAKAVVGQTIY